MLESISEIRRDKILRSIELGSYKIAKVVAVQAIPQDRFQPITTALRIISILEEVDALIAEKEKSK